MKVRHYCPGAAFALMLTVAQPGAAMAKEASSAELLKGNWKLVALEQGKPGGKLSPVGFTGQIIFTNGIVAVQAMHLAGDSPDNPYSVAGYEAYYGQYRIAPSGKSVFFDVKSSVVRRLIGQSLERGFEVSENRLVLRPVDPKENWRVTYQRY